MIGVPVADATFGSLYSTQIYSHLLPFGWRELYLGNPIEDRKNIRRQCMHIFIYHILLMFDEDTYYHLALPYSLLTNLGVERISYLLNNFALIPSKVK